MYSVEVVRTCKDSKGRTVTLNYSTGGFDSKAEAYGHGLDFVRENQFPGCVVESVTARRQR